MSMYFEAVLVAADQCELIRLLKGLSELEGAPFAQITLQLHQVDDAAFVVFGGRTGSNRPDAAAEIEKLADILSLEFGSAVAVHYDDQVGTKAAQLSRDGVPVQSFGEADEVWVPYGDDGELVMDGPRYSSDEIPDDVECDCICNGIDAALEAAEIQWVDSAELVQVAYRAHRSEPLWQRPLPTCQ